jgi:protein-tyrosine phosphatase
MQNILVLCIGNICRSPMAEGMLRHALPEKTICSAGLGALVGHPADPLAVQLMHEQGIDITAHRAQSISSRLVNEAQLILTMDLEQKKYVETHYVAAKGKVFRLGEVQKFDVADPYRQGIGHFRASQTLIAEGVDAWVQRLARLG